MSAVEPPKKRGRPKKVVADEIDVAKRTASTKVIAKDSEREKERPSKKKGGAKSPKTVNAPAEQDVQKIVAQEVIASITPEKSKILEEVRKLDHMKLGESTSSASAKKKSKASSAKQTSIPRVESQLGQTVMTTKSKTSISPPPSSQSSPLSSQPTPATPSRTPQLQPKPKHQPQPPPPPPPPRPTRPSPSSASISPSLLQPRTTTIPLPKHPSPAPSPLSHPPPLPTENPLNTSTEPPPVYPKPAKPRVVNPSQPFGPLPEKYRATSRRLTAIIVGIPFIIVGGIDLWNRWKREWDKKWDENGNRI